MLQNMSEYKAFYENANRDTTYTKGTDLEEHGFFAELTGFIEKYGLKESKVLEIGSGKGLFQAVAQGYLGIDIADSLAKYYKDKNSYVVVEDGSKYPFSDNAFDGAFTYATFEHIPDINLALEELLRVVSDGGYILFHAAWQVRPWAADGLAVRQFKDLSFIDKLKKCTIPVRDSIIWRSLFIFPRRAIRLMQFLLSESEARAAWRLKCKPLKANYDVFWVSDSDACNHLDICEAMLWFMSRNCRVVSHSSIMKMFMARTGSFIVQVRKS